MNDDDAVKAVQTGFLAINMVAIEDNPKYFENVADLTGLLTDFRNAAKAMNAHALM